MVDLLQQLLGQFSDGLVSGYLFLFEDGQNR